MARCCESKSCEVTALRERHARVLWIALAINASMFVVEAVSGYIAHSSALMADALDMFGDASVYAFSLFVIGRSVKWQASAALVKGVLMLLLGVFVLGETLLKLLHPVVPVSETMGIVGTLALAANLLCFGLLYSHRTDNLNMRSTWLCSRNDLIANAGVLVAAGGVYLLQSGWPDIIVGTLIAAIFLRSALQVIQEALASASGAPRVG